jgi:PHP family Zn ribbon phosphoesterase
MSHQVQVKCKKCNTILNFSAEDEVERKINCIECGQEITVRWTYIKVAGVRFSKVYTKNCKFVPESQRMKYNY